MRLSNGILSLELDDGTGSLVQIEDLRAGIRHLASAADGRLFRVVAPDEENWLGRYCDSHESGKPEMKAERGRAVVRYPDLLTGEGKPSGISATVTVELPQGADEARFTIELQNGGLFLIHEVWFPRVGGWRGYAGRDKDRMTIGCACTIDPFAVRGGMSSGYTLAKSHRRRFYCLPASMSLPMVDLSGGGRGLSYVHYPKSVRTGGVVVEDLNERGGDVRPAWTWVHQPFIKPGQKWVSDPVGVAPHTGDWHATADRLRAWLQTWWKAPDAPARLRGAIGYFNMQFREFEGRELAPLSAAPGAASHALEHGFQDFCLWDAIMAVYLKPGTGDFFEDAPERIAELKRVLREIRAMGVQVSTLINLRLLTHKYKPWGQWGERRMMRSLYGQYRSESWPCRSYHAAFFNSFLEEGGVVLCQNNPEFQQWALDTVRKALDLGFSSLFMDQPFETGLCFSAAHGHDVPAHGHEGACQWIEQAARIIRQRDPEAYAIGENADIWNGRFIQLWWNWNWAAQPSEVFRYVLPDSLQSWIIDAYEPEHQRQVGKAFAMGFLLSVNVRGLERPLSDVPEFAARIKQLAALRRRTEAFTVRGRFCDQQGMSVDTDAHVAAYVYDAGGSLGIVMSDVTEGQGGSGGRVKLTLDPGTLGLKKLPESVRLYRQDGRAEALKTAAQGGRIELETRLGRWESAVLEVPRLAAKQAPRGG